MDVSLSDTQQERFAAFWNRNSDRCPCVGVQVSASGIRAPLCGAALPEPWLLDIETLRPWYEAKYAEWTEIEQDAVWTAAPPPQFRWLEGMLAPHGEIAEPGSSDRNRWLKSYRKIRGRLGEISGGRFPVADTTFSGIVDLIVHAAGNPGIEAMKSSSPGRIADLARLAADRVSGLFDGPLADGAGSGRFLSGLHLWAPGTVYRYQERSGQLLSAAEYRELVLPSVKSFIGRFDHVVFYARRNVLHLLEVLLPLSEIDAYEIFVGPQEPSFADLLPLIRRIQDSGKSVVVRGMVVQEDVERAREELHWRGIYLLLTKETLGEARFWASHLVNRGPDAGRTGIPGGRPMG